MDKEDITGKIVDVYEKKHNGREFIIITVNSDDGNQYELKNNWEKGYGERFEKAKRFKDQGTHVRISVWKKEKHDRKEWWADIKEITDKPIPESNTLFDTQEFSNKDYIKKVVIQINASYDRGLYDCCAVMIRRLLETLIIESYENLGRAKELKDSNGHFVNLSGLISFLDNDSDINVARNTMKGLKGFKKIADSSAHNRRHNASQKDIDDKIGDIQLAVKELLVLAFPKK